MARAYTTRRQQIVKALVEKLKGINRTGPFLTNVNNNVQPRLLFWDEVESFPAVHVNAGSETREYLGGGVKTRFLTITLRCYVKTSGRPGEDNSSEALDRLLEDIETVIEDNSSLAYVDRSTPPQTHGTQQITIVNISTDEGVLEPLGVGEMQIEVRY